MPRKVFTRTNRFLVRHRLLVFLTVMLTELLLFAFVQSHSPRYLAILEMSFFILIIAGIYIVTTNPRIVVISFLLGVLTITVIWFNSILESHDLHLLSLLLEIIFLGFTTGIIINHVLQYKRVAADKIYGAICGYFLLGMMWALIYTLIENTFPGSFNLGRHVFGSEQIAHHYYFSELLYYSFVTITTLGYGDIVPLTDLARMFSSFEAMFGQLYLAVLISRLVGLHIVHTHRKHNTEKDF